VVVVDVGVVGDPEHPGDERTFLGPVLVPVFDDLEEDGLDQVFAGSSAHHPTTRHTLSKKLNARPLLDNTGTPGKRLWFLPKMAEESSV